MRITFLTQYFPPEMGAPQARLSELAQRFVRAGHEVTVLTAMPNYPTGQIYPGYGGVFRREEFNGIPVLRTAIYPTQSIGLLKRLLNYFSFVLTSMVVGALYLKQTDYLLVESPPLFLGISAVVLSRAKRAKLIFNVSDLWPESAIRVGAIKQGSISARVGAWLERWCYKQAWLVTGQSRGILQSITERFPRVKTFHLSNGVDVRKFRPDIANSDARQKMQGEDKVVALYAGLHGIAQGLEQLIDAAERVKNNSNIHFCLIGDGPEKDRLVEEAERQRLDNMTFLEPVPAAEIPGLVASADISLITLKMYIPGAVPSKLYEAMAAGRPIVLVAVGEAASIVERYNAGIAIKPGDIDALVQALLTLSADAGHREELGTNGRRAAERYFNRDLIAQRFICFLEERLVRED